MRVRWAAVIAAAVSAAACASLRTGRAPEVRLTHGVAVGETSDTRAVVWARCEAPGILEVSVGPMQRAWLEAGLAESTATWKFVVSSVPMSIPTGADARDGWADGGGVTGFERELVTILRAAARDRVPGLVWITTDVHFATGLRYRPFTDAPDFVVHEFVSGPLAAGLFPKDALDPTLRPGRLFFHGPPAGREPRTLDAALPWFNFGLVEVDVDGRLSVSIVDGTGRTRHRVTLTSR